ncbi:hypothetical protein [Clostridium baratii]|uniref:hypothetical protein n=1 Tax=Clostridium baratii TaxID=1561 RepID=UPI0005F2AE00|nr:hypothetical protein [Clostridium baratii]AQM58623.1 hypothetical protein NPD11_3046 [Clostridium baratii]KJU71562.1 hypothetical protein UC77_09110 [Clostridium baratii]
MYKNLNYSEKQSIKNSFFIITKIKKNMRKHSFMNSHKCSFSKAVNIIKLLDLLALDSNITLYINRESLINDFLDLSESFANHFSKYLLKSDFFNYLSLENIIDDFASEFNIDIKHAYFSDLSLEYTLNKASDISHFDNCFDIYNDIYEFKKTFKELSSISDEDTNNQIIDENDLVNSIVDTFGNYFADEAFCICLKKTIFNDYIIDLLSKYLFNRNTSNLNEEETLLLPNVFTDGNNTHIFLPSILEVDELNQYFAIILIIALLNKIK